jgi:hypothetical protein
MKRISHFGMGLLALAVALGAMPARAQYANEFTIAKVTKEGTTTHPIAGSGTVEVKVQVNPDGTHKVIGVLNSTNEGDNAAALEIAQNSTYRPAHRGSTPVVSFYSFVLKFNGKSVASGGDTPQSGTAGAAIEDLIRGGKYADAISKANVALLNSPGNPQYLQLLGAAQFFNGDQAAAASSFAKVPTIDKQFAQIAANAFASAAVKDSATDPAASMELAQKAVALSNTSNSEFALGVAQVADKQYTAGIATLTPVRDKATDNATKLAIDRQLLSAYLGSNDTAGADAVAAQMKQLDPSGNSAGTAIAVYYVNLGNTAMQGKDYSGALAAYDKAAAAGDSKLAVTAALGATLAILQMPKPDFTKARDYASKAVAGMPDDPQANYYAGLAYADYAANVSHSDKDKEQGVTYLKKADTLAKAAGNVGLSLQIENQLKAIQP